MATVFDDDRKRMVKTPEPSAPDDANEPTFSEGLIVLVFMAFLSLFGLGLFSLMPR
jgi:hypothetical protein